MSFFATVVRIVKRIALTIMVVFLSIVVLAFIFLGDSEPQENGALQENARQENRLEEARLKLAEKNRAEEKARNTMMKTIENESLILRDASLCLVVGEWALYKADDSTYGLTKANLEIADALAKKGQDWIKNFVNNVGENSYLHQAYLESKSENTKKCESVDGFNSCWSKCMSAFE